MKTSLTILFVFFCSFAWAQSTNFISISSKLDNHIKKNQWDEVILLAPDLLIEDPLRGDGYYYLAYAFYELNEATKSTEYLELAVPLADQKLKARIGTLKELIRGRTQNKQTAVLAQQLERENKLRPAADAWKKAWEAGKANLDFALNAVTNYISLKDYPAALAILNDPQVKSDQEAIELIGRLNETGQMKNINGYSGAMASGDQLMLKENYSSALTKFEEALSFKPSDRTASDKKNEAIDEIAWQAARKTNTIESYESYLKGRTLKQHSTAAHGIIQRSLIGFGESAAKNDNVSDMETYFNKYFSDYPGGNDTDKARRVMCETYYRVALGNTSKKDAYSQQQASELFSKADKLCLNKPDIAGRIKKANKLATRYGRPDRTFYTFAYDSLLNYGISIGSVKTRGIGMYFTIRLNEDILSSMGAANGTVDNSGKVTGGQFADWGNDWRFKNETTQAAAEGVIGITHKITYPLWIYAGAGVSYNQLYWKMDIYDNNKKYHDTDWVKNSDGTKIKPVFESGLIVDLMGLNLRGGMKTEKFDKFVLTLGVGFSLKQ
jgi:thioredoxin-like negative regulator of GroEL